MSAALVFDNVVKRYGRRRALDGFSLTVPEGAFFGLVGSNGAGKTTCLSVATGIMRVNDGSITVLGEGTFRANLHCGRMSWVPQDSGFPRYAKVSEMLLFYARLQGIRPPHDRRQVAELLEWVHLADRANDRIYKLSHGMRRRITIAQAFLGAPEMILMDEPLSGLDPREVAGIRRLLMERRGEQTMLLSSHNLQEIERLCDRVAFIEHGKLVREDTLDSVVGRFQMLRIIVDTDDLDPATLRIEGLNLEFDRQTRSLVVNDPAGKLDGIQMNNLVLSKLLEQGVGIEQVLRGAELESVYLAQFKGI